jgi:hypothetical protein
MELMIWADKAATSSAFFLDNNLVGGYKTRRTVRPRGEWRSKTGIRLAF